MFRSRASPASNWRSRASILAKAISTRSCWPYERSSMRMVSEPSRQLFSSRTANSATSLVGSSSTSRRLKLTQSGIATWSIASAQSALPRLSNSGLIVREGCLPKTRACGGKSGCVVATDGKSNAYEHSLPRRASSFGIALWPSPTVWSFLCGRRQSNSLGHWMSWTIWRSYGRRASFHRSSRLRWHAISSSGWSSFGTASSRLPTTPPPCVCSTLG